MARSRGRSGLNPDFVVGKDDRGVVDQALQGRRFLRVKAFAVAGEGEFAEEFVLFLFVGLVSLRGDAFGDGDGGGDGGEG